jgi:hypothetical protein
MTEADRKTERNIVVDRNKLLGVRNNPTDGTTENDNSINLKLGVKVGVKPPLPSDIRLKTNVHQVGTTAHNLPLYTFNYLGEDDLYEGVMAQDVLKVMPAAVIVGDDGYYRVKYDMLGVELRRLGPSVCLGR